jgi:hypothetical protein
MASSTLRVQVQEVRHLQPAEDLGHGRLGAA